MTRETTTTTSRPVLDEATFQCLLCAAHLMQECNDRLTEAASATAENVRVKPHTQEPLNVPVPDVPQESPIPMEQADIEPGESHNDSLIPPETDNRLSVLASQLSSTRQQVSTEPERKTTQAVAGSQEISGIEEQTPKHHPETMVSEQPHPEPAEMLQPVQSAVPDEVHTQISLTDDFFGRTVRVFAIAAVFLLGVLAYRLVSGPDRLALSSEAVQPRAPLEKTTGMARRRIGAELNRVNFPDGSEALAADKDAKVASAVLNTIRADQRLQAAKVQVKASDGIVTLSGDVGSDAERTAAAQDATQIGGFEALINKLRVINPNREGPIVSSSGTLRNPIASPETHPTSLQAAGVSSISSRASGPPVDRLPRTSEQITVPYGTPLAVRLAETLSSGLNQPGDTFLASLVSPIVIGDRVVIPAGASVKGKIVDARNARRFSGRSTLAIEVTQLAYNGRTYELHSSQYLQQGASRNTYAAAATTGGTGVGALLGTVVGRGKGAAIGSALGAAMGTGMQAVTKRASAELAAESTLEFRLETPLTLQVPSTRTDLGQGSFSSNDRPVLKQRSTIPLSDTEPPSMSLQPR
jgi:BON domain